MDLWVHKTTTILKLDERFENSNMNYLILNAKSFVHKLMGFLLVTTSTNHPNSENTICAKKAASELICMMCIHETSGLLIDPKMIVNSFLRLLNVNDIQSREAILYFIYIITKSNAHYLKVNV